MPSNNWERDWAERVDADPEGNKLTKEEIALAKKLWGHMRHMVSYNSEIGATVPDDGRVDPMLVKNADGYYPDDDRRISPSHNEGWMHIEHRGTYWEVSWGSREFSSSFSAVGRGRTLAEAMADCEANQ